MSSTPTLREQYVDARDDVRRAEADRAQLLTGLSRLDALFDATRRGDTDRNVQAAVRDYTEVVGRLEYGRPELSHAGLTSDGPTFAKFGVDEPAALVDPLERFYDDQRELQFEDLVTCIQDAIAGGGESFAPLSELVEDLVDAFESRDRERFEDRMAAIVDGLLDRGVQTANDLKELLEAERGTFVAEDLLSLQYDADYRSTAVTALVEAVQTGDAPAFVAARGPFERTARALDAFARRRQRDLERATEDLTDEYPADHATPHPRLDNEIPVLLTPTRLETRFRRRTDENGDPVTDPPRHELLIRVYPDDLHVDTHERGLTDAEVERGAWFWEQVWWASHLGDAEALHDALADAGSESMLDGVDLAEFPEDAAARHAAVKERAWNTLAERFGDERAAWVKRAMAPDDSEALLAGPPENGHILDADVEAFGFEMDDEREQADRRPGAWTRPPRARLLPDQWIAFAETNGGERTATSNPVQRPLSIGPDPGSFESATDTAEDRDDFRTGEIEWVFDFDVAEEVGMALRIPLVEAEVSAGIDRLTVIGVSTGLDGTEAATELANLLESHRYTDGLSVLERGTPTNDTRDAGAATAPSGDEPIYERECTRPALSPADEDADGVRIAELLRIEPDVIGTDRPFVFNRVSGAARSLNATAAATNTALWSATLGYYVPHMLAPNDWTDGISERRQLVRWLENYRRHFVSYVRAGGPVQPLRVGSQPYGIVPTTAFGDWESVSKFMTVSEMDPELDDEDFGFRRYDNRNVPAHLHSLLGVLRPLWADAVDQVPSVDSPDDPEVVASKLLSMAGTSYGYRLRDLVGDEAMAALPNVSPPQDRLRDARDEAQRQLSTGTDVDRVPRVGNLLADEHAPVIDAPVTRNDLSSVLRALRTTRHHGLRSGPPGTDVDLEEFGDLGDLGGTGTWPWSLYFLADRSLTEVLCYHAILQGYRLARIRIGDHYENWAQRLEAGASWQQAPWSLLPEPQVYDRSDRTMWDALEDDVPDRLTGHPKYRDWWTIGDYLRWIPALDRPFAELVSAFETLEDGDPDIVDRLVRETLDLASHRYDAWATSLATRRLDGMDETGTDGLYVGGYGYVEELERETDHRSKGYIQAPSIDQATAAAVLRSAHDAETEEYGNTFAVDLSADRVREARTLLEGIRAGHSLGELVGARFERALHESYPDVELDQYVYAFRSLAPLIEGRIDREGTEKSDAAAARAIVDGAALYELWRNDAIPWGQHVGTAEIDALPPADEDDDAYTAIREELEAIETAFDSLSDILAAEGVYQLVRDNPERAGAALDALSRGEAIEDVEVTETPRTGTSCTHRLIALFDPNVTDSTWAPGDSARAAAEPSLDDWISTIMGDPTRVVCRVAFETTLTDGDGNDGGGGGGSDGTDGDGDDADDAEDDPDWRIVAVRLSQLDLSALDVVSLVEGDEAAWGSELEARIEYHVRRTREDVASDGDLRLSFAPPAEWPDAEAIGGDPAADVGFGELLEVARSVRSVVSNARPVDARDVAVPGEITDAGQVVGDLRRRATEAYDTFETTLEDLQALVDALAADPETDERVVDDLVALVDAIEEIPAEGLGDAESALQAVDGSDLHEDLQALSDAITGSGALVARVEVEKVVLSPDEQVVVGLADAGEDLQVKIKEPNRDPLTRSIRADDDGRFVAEFESEELEPGDEFTVTVRHDNGHAVTYEGLVRERRPPHTLSLTALEQFAAVTAVLGDVAGGAQPVVDAGGALDGDVIDEAIATLNPAVWAAEDSGDLEDIRDVPSVPLPGFESVSGWRRLAMLTQAVAAGEVSAELVREVELDANVPSTTRLDRLRQTLDRGLSQLSAGVAAAEGRPDQALIAATLATVRDALLVCADYGIHGSVPLSAAGATREDLEALARQGQSVHEEADEMREAAKRHRNKGHATDDPDAYVACLEALFGEKFTVLVPFEPTNPGELSNGLDATHSDTLQEGDPLAVERWFDRVERVREEVERFGRTLTYGETFGDRSPADGARFQVGQLPYEADDRWVGLPDAWADEHPTGRLSVVAHVHGSQSGAQYVGLFVDEFVETVPNDAETTGLSFHYDRPANQAPQSMLLAVPPTDEDWSVETLADVVRESVELAKLRTVDRDALGDLGHILPGLAVATNETAYSVGPDTASVDPEDLLADWRAHWGGGD